MNYLFSIPLLAGLKAFFERLMFFGLVFAALRNKENVAARFGGGQFELTATGQKLSRLRP